MTRIPQIAGDSWLNSKPLYREDLAGKVILIEFWTYTCVDCLRSIPYLKRWWRDYAGPGFVLRGHVRGRAASSQRKGLSTLSPFTMRLMRQ